MMMLFQEELSGTTVISVGHRAELEEFHTRKLTLRRHAMTEEPSDEKIQRRRRLATILRRGLRPRASPDSSRPISR
jgi:putative ATP-binding cassette transporter